jgi:hypothetical protein
MRCASGPTANAANGIPAADIGTKIQHNITEKILRENQVH